MRKDSPVHDGIIGDVVEVASDRDDVVGENEGEKNKEKNRSIENVEKMKEMMKKIKNSLKEGVDEVLSHKTKSQVVRKANMCK